MITIGVTGGVGAGKSEILHYLERQYNCRILLSDDAAKELELPGGAIYGPLVSLLTEWNIPGDNEEPLLFESGEINKKEMARRIFSDAELLRKVNELVHPAVNRYKLEEIERERKEGKREFFVLESALLVENGYDKVADSLWFIFCEKSVRAQRLRMTRGYSDEKIRQIMEKQVSDDVFRKFCDVVINNTGPLDAEGGPLEQVDAAIAGLREKFKDRA